MIKKIIIKIEKNKTLKCWENEEIFIFINNEKDGENIK